MLALLVLLALSSTTLAQNVCSTEDAREVQNVWKYVWSAEFTGRRIALAQQVFKDLFENNPDVIPLFSGVNGDDVNSNEFRAHCVRVVNGLDTSLNLLTSSAVLNQQLSHLGDQHAQRGVKAAQFGALAKSFAKMMPQVTSCFNSQAWGYCFGRIADGISATLP